MCIQERGCINETNSPLLLVAKSNQQKGGWGVISSEYGNYVSNLIWANMQALAEVETCCIEGMQVSSV